MIIDFHHHLLSGENYTKELISIMDECNIQYTCISGLGIGKNRNDTTEYNRYSLGSISADNTDVLKEMRKYPDRIIGMGVVDLDKDTPDTIRRFRDDGFKGLKTTRPKHNYDYDEYMPIYEQAEKEGLPFLFHTGMILTTCFDKDDDVSSDRMRPILLDRVARTFPGLNIIIAHLGYPWFDEAATMVRFHKNVYTDFTASSYGWRNRLSPSDYQRYLFFDKPFEKVIFGTDVPAKLVLDSYREQKLLFDNLNVDAKTQEMIFGGTARKLLDI